jgi:hypothetical protein
LAVCGFSSRIRELPQTRQNSAGLRYKVCSEESVYMPATDFVLGE